MLSQMPTRGRVLAAWVVVLIAGGLVLGVVLSTGSQRHEPARVDRATEDAALAVVDARLRTGWGGLRVPATGPAEPGWACTQLVIESAWHGTDLRVGLVASCEQFVRAPDALVSRAGYSAVPMVVTLIRDPDGLRIAGIEQAQDGGGLPASIRRMFTAQGAAVVLDGARPASPNTVARQVFGLADSVPVR